MQTYIRCTGERDEMIDVEEVLRERACTCLNYKASDSCFSPKFLDFAIYTFINDPSAGSPTETLLRLLLPLNDQV